MRRTSVLTGRNFSPARNVRSMTAPSAARRSLVRTNAPPLPGLTCWNSTILKIVPSTSMCDPLRNWLVEIMPVGQCRERPRSVCDDQLFADAGEDLAAGGGHRDQVLDSHPEAARQVD